MERGFERTTDHDMIWIDYNTLTANSILISEGVFLVLFSVLSVVFFVVNIFHKFNGFINAVAIYLTTAYGYLLEV